jgi:hypothetical protein
VRFILVDFTIPVCANNDRQEVSRVERKATQVRPSPLPDPLRAVRLRVHKRGLEPALGCGRTMMRPRIDTSDVNGHFLST